MSKEIVINVQGPNVRACVAFARRSLAIDRKLTPVIIRSGGEDGLYRVHLRGGYIVECAVIRNAICKQ